MHQTGYAFYLLGLNLSSTTFEYISIYGYGRNNPINLVDPLGLSSDSTYEYYGGELEPIIVKASRIMDHNERLNAVLRAGGHSGLGSWNMSLNSGRLPQPTEAELKAKEREKARALSEAQYRARVTSGYFNRLAAATNVSVVAAWAVSITLAPGNLTSFRGWAAWDDVNNWAEESRRLFRTDVEQHQWVSEQITLKYGSDVGLIYGMAKEVRDLLDRNPRSHADWRDIYNDLLGIGQGITGCK